MSLPEDVVEVETATRVRRSGALLVLAALALAPLAMPACSDDALADQPCTSIPAGGCPISRGLACEDPSCEAVYACRSGNVWELDRTCPPREAGAPRDAGIDAPPVVPEPDAAPDAPPGANGGPGCGALQAPDCSLGFALVCPSGCCDCEDLFVCADQSWSLWGTCSAQEGIRQRR